MKEFLFALLPLFPVLLVGAPHPAQAAVPDTMQRLQAIEDRLALKKLVDTFSNLADRKDVKAQVLLFTEDATVESRNAGRAPSLLKGRDQIEKTFSSFLAGFDTVYHLNGQQTVELRGDRATGVSYCNVVLIGTGGGKRVKTTMGVTYEDEYVKRGGTWLIAKRVSHFKFTDRSELPPLPAR